MKSSAEVEWIGVLNWMYMGEGVSGGTAVDWLELGRVLLWGVCGRGGAACVMES